MIESLKNTLSDLLSSVSTTQLIIAAAVLAVLILIVVLIVVWRHRVAARREAPSFFDEAPTDTFSSLGRADQLRFGDHNLLEPEEEFEQAPDVPPRQVAPPPSVTQHPPVASAGPSAPAAPPGQQPAPLNTGFNWDETPAPPLAVPPQVAAAAQPAARAAAQPAAAKPAAAQPAVPARPAAQVRPAAVPPAQSATPAQAKPASPATRPAAGSAPARAATPVELWAGKLVPLNQLVNTPSDELVDLSDPEVRKMLMDFVTLKIERALELRRSGQIAEAVTKLAQAEKITRTLGLDEATQHVHGMIAELNRPRPPRP